MRAPYSFHARPVQEVLTRIHERTRLPSSEIWSQYCQIADDLENGGKERTIAESIALVMVDDWADVEAKRRNGK